MSFLGDIGSMLGIGAGQVGSGLFSAASGLLGNMFAAERQSNAQDFSAAQYASRYQTTVKDLEAAGLNPMMAYGQMGGGAPSGSPVGASMPDIGQAISQSKIANAQEANLNASARKLNAEASITEDVGLDKAKAELNQVLTQTGLTAAQIANVKADTQNKETQTANIEADTALKRGQLYLTTAQEGLAGASADAARANVGYLETKAKSISDSIANIPKEGARLDALVKNLGAEFKLIQEKSLTQEQATKQMKWLAVRTMLESDLAGAEVRAIMQSDNFGKEFAQYKGVIDVLTEVAKLFGRSSTVYHKRGN